MIIIKKKYHYLLFFLLFAGNIDSHAQEATYDWQYLNLKGVIADDVQASCSCNFDKKLYQLKEKLKYKVDENAEYFEDQGLDNIDLQCAFGAIEPKIELLVKNIELVKDKLLLEGTTKKSTYFSTWSGKFTKQSFEGYLFDFGKIDSVAFSLKKNDSLQIDFDILEFAYSKCIYNLTNLDTDNQILHETLELDCKNSSQATLDSLTSKYDVWASSALDLYQKIHIPKKTTPEIEKLYKQLFLNISSANELTYDEAKFVDSLQKQLKLPIEKMIEKIARKEEIKAFTGEMQYGKNVTAYTTSAIEYNNDNILSLCFDNYTYTGGMQGSSFATCHTIDLTTNSLIKLNDIFEDGTACILFKKMIAATINYAKENSTGGIYYDYLEDCDKQNFEANFPEYFYLTPSGITMIHQKYTYFPGSAGIVMVDIPSVDLQNITKKESLAWQLWYEGE